MFCMDSTLEKLMRAGLPGNEARVFLELLSRSPISANILAKKLGMDRTLIYQVLGKLVERGLVSHTIKDNKKYFEATNPENLLIKVQEQEKLINDILPELKNREKIKETEQEVKVFEGKNALRHVFEELPSLEEISIFGGTGRSYDVLKFEIKGIEKRALKSKLKARIIWNKELKGHPMTKLPFMKARYLKDVKSDATTTIYKGGITIHVLTEKPMIIRIKNKEIAEGYKNYFEFMWKNAKE